LTDPTDAYEWSFVAVPAQREAGVIKRFSGKRGSASTLSEYVEKSGRAAFEQEFKTLCREAELGRRYLGELRGEVVRLGLLSGCGLSAGLLESAASKMEIDELLGFRDAFSARVDELLPPVTQLCVHRGEEKFEPESEFII